MTLAEQTQARLTAAGFTADDPAIAAVRAWNAQARAGRPLPPCGWPSCPVHGSGR